MKIKLQLPLGEDMLHFLADTLNILSPGETILKANKAGEGNMNVVLRITTNFRSVILKQSRPFVHKYPQIPAPFERVSVEKAFYDTIAGQTKLASMTPSPLAFDEESQLLALEDLGASSDFTAIYSGSAQITDHEIVQLAEFLFELHSLQVDSFPSNTPMKVLNHEHIFSIPFLETPPINLNSVQSGLEEIAQPFRFDNVLKKAIVLIGNRYLLTGKTLLHGDFYPGSWLKSADGICVIDTEFAYLGDREFDLGVLIAHLAMAGIEEGKSHLALETYGTTQLNLSLLRKYAGVEILRRLFGVAQLPLMLTLEEKFKLANLAKTMILDA
jgi:5-methylthioribose kinase